LKGTMRTVLELLDSQLETVLVDGNYYKGRMEQLLEMPADLRELDERRRAATDDVKALERRLFKVQHAVQELAQLGGEIAAKSDRVAALRSELETIPAGYDAVRHDLVRRELDRLMPLDAKATRLGAQIAAATAESELASAEAAEAQARHAAAELEERQRLLGELTVRKRLHEELD